MVPLMVPVQVPLMVPGSGSVDGSGSGSVDGSGSGSVAGSVDGSGSGSVDGSGSGEDTPPPSVDVSCSGFGDSPNNESPRLLICDLLGDGTCVF